MTDQGPPVLVRGAGPADPPLVRRLVEAAGLPVDGLADVAVLLVAESAGRVVGGVALERHGEGAGTAFLLRSAVVDAGMRSRGVGEALVVAALRQVDAAGAPVALLTETAPAWFPRFGFSPVPRGALPPALAASPEMQGACPASAHALLRPASG